MMEEKNLLQSWKEISDYLDCSVRTCHRWEVELGLPVHRLDGTPKARIFAYKDELDRWRSEKLHLTNLPDEIQEKPLRPKAKIIAVGAAALAAVAAVSFFGGRALLQRKDLALPLSSKPTLAVFVFKNLSGFLDDEWLRTGLPDLIVMDLSQSKYVEVLNVDRFYGGPLYDLKIEEAKNSSREDLLKLAKAAAVDRIVLGSFMRAGSKLLINFTLQNIHSGEQISTRVLDCRSEVGIPDMIDDLTKQIKADLGLGSRRIAGDFDMKLGKIMAWNPEALKCYFEGHRTAGRDAIKARSLLKKAVEIDPEFAMAYKTLGTIARNKKEDLVREGSREERERYWKRALELSHRLSVRERFAIQVAMEEEFEKNTENAIETYKKFLRLYPDDSIAHSRIANLYMRLEDWESYIKHREFLYKMNRSSKLNVMGLVSGYMHNRIGAYDKAVAVLKDFLANEAPEDHDVRWRLYEAYWRSGKYELALEEADALEAKIPSEKVDRIQPYYLMSNYPAAEKLCLIEAQKEKRESPWLARDWLQDIYLAQGQIEKAREQIILGLQEEEQGGPGTKLQGKMILRGRLAALYLIGGQPESALREWEKSWELVPKREDMPKTTLSPEWHLLARKVEILLAMGRMEEAQEAAAKMREIIEQNRLAVEFLAIGRETWMRQELKCCDYVAGTIELKKGNAAKALEELKKADSYILTSIPRIWIISALADAYEASGDFSRAREEYEKIPTLTGERILQGHRYTQSFHRLGQICERQGDRNKAIEYYGKFIELMKNADRTLPQVEAARSRLSALMSR